MRISDWSSDVCSSDLDADAIAVGIPFPDRPVGGVENVVLDALAPLQMARVLECASVAAGAAIVDLQHGVATVREHLRFPVERPVVARADRPAVGVDAERQVLAFGPTGNGEVTVDDLHIAGCEDRKRGV